MDVKADLLISGVNEVRFSGVKNFSITTEMGMHHE
jgi:hypothetical protein